MPEFVYTVSCISFCPGEKRSCQYIPDKLKTCKSVWIRVDRVCKPLEAPYVGPFHLLCTTDKYFLIKINNDIQSTILIDRFYPHVESKSDKPFRKEKQPHSDDRIIDTENMGSDSKPNHKKTGRKVFGKEMTNITTSRLCYRQGGLLCKTKSYLSLTKIKS